MKLETFFDKFELFADAPDAVAKMRELVLGLAVKGRLVLQNSGEEPAKAQLARLSACVSERRSTGRARKTVRATPERWSSRSALPAGWASTTLSDLVTVWNGRAYAKDELLADGTPVLRVGNLFTSNRWYYSDLDLEQEKYCERGDLIFAWSASFGPFIWDGPRAIYHYHIWKLVPHNEVDIDKRFIYWLLQQRTREIKESGHGVSMTHMTKEKMEKLWVALPPLAEQRRIVAKVDELMALVDKLEAQLASARITATNLLAAAVAELTQGKPSDAAAQQ